MNIYVGLMLTLAIATTYILVQTSLGLPVDAEFVVVAPVTYLLCVIAHLAFEFLRDVWGIGHRDREISRLQAELTASKASQRRLEGNVSMLDRRVHELIDERDGLKAELDKVRGIAAIVAPKRGPNGRFEKRQQQPPAAA